MDWDKPSKEARFYGVSPATDLARTWQGHRYGLQALKPCLEFIAIAQKPYAGRPVDSIVETGAGALWIDGGRVGTVPPSVPQPRFNSPTGRTYGFQCGEGRSGQMSQNNQGRWPPNCALCHVPPTYHCQQCQAIHPVQPVIEVCPDCGGELEWVEGCKRVGMKRVKGHNGIRGSDEGNAMYGGGKGLQRPETGQQVGYADPDGLETVTAYDCAEGCVVQRLGEMSGHLKSGALTRSETARAEVGKHGIYGVFKGKPDGAHFPSSEGTAARFFPQADWEMECCESCPVRRLDEQSEPEMHGAGHARDGKRQADDTGMFGLPGDGHRFGDSGGASRFYPQADYSHETAERLAQADPFKYQPKSPKKERNQGLDDFYWWRDKSSPSGFVRVGREEWEALGKRERARGNIHPTVKPLGLLKWLATLLLPPPEYAPRRILIPFAGSGSEAIAAMLTGWEEITGIELLQDYVNIADARAAFWAIQQRQLGLF
jgi:hypothetical protein